LSLLSRKRTVNITIIKKINNGIIFFVTWHPKSFIIKLNKIDNKQLNSMKKLFALLTITGFLSFGMLNTVYAQDETATEEVVAEGEEVMEEAPVEEVAEEPVAVAAPVEEEVAPAADESFTQIIKQKFIEGGPGFMGIVLVCLILGLAIVIERIIYLNMSTTNTNKLLSGIESALASGGVDAAKEVCRNTKGPVASIFYQGLDRSHEGIDMVEKSVVSYGGVQMGLLEKGISWISLFIALAPMLGFMGTVIGMIGAFDAIAAAGDISPAVVADGIKVALLTTVFGLIVAIILQIFYNYIVAKVDSLVNDMENASISLIDLLVKNELSNK
jgi:biopolymer transport protein ExbB